MTILETLQTDVIEGAKALLGAHLVLGELRSQIVETEAYRTPDDPGCHAHRGKTPRTAVMFGPPGFAYMYFTYGNHFMLNIVAHGEDDAAAVLIRAAKPISGVETMFERRPKAKKETDLLSGPGKLAAAYGLTINEHNGKNLFGGQGLHIEEGVRPKSVLVGPRIGLARGKGEEINWRFVDGDEMEFVSSTRAGLG